MMIRLSILLTFFSISFAYAHPNHMSFEDVQHNDEQTQAVLTNTDKVTYHKDEKIKHSEIIPCTEQHKIVPCKKK